LEPMGKTTRFLTGLMLLVVLSAPAISFAEPQAPPLPQPRIDRTQTVPATPATPAPVELAPVENLASPDDSAGDMAGATPTPLRPFPS